MTLQRYLLWSSPNLFILTALSQQFFGASARSSSWWASSRGLPSRAPAFSTMSVPTRWVSFAFLKGTFDARSLLGPRTLRAMHVLQCTCVAGRGARRLVCLEANRLTAWSGKSCLGCARSFHGARSTSSYGSVPRRPSQPSWTRQVASHDRSSSLRKPLCALFSTGATRSSQCRSVSRLHCDAHYTPSHAAPQS